MRKHNLASKGARGDQEIIRARFFALISPEPNSGCWLYTAEHVTFRYCSRTDSLPERTSVFWGQPSLENSRQW